MHTVVLSTEETPESENIFAFPLWKNLTDQQRHRSRVYRIYVDEPRRDIRFVLMTTSKDLNLKLSQFDWHVHYHFANFLEQEFARENCGQLLLCLKDGSNNSEEGLLVTKTVEAGSVIFTISVAR